MLSTNPWGSTPRIATLGTCSKRHHASKQLKKTRTALLRVNASSRRAPHGLTSESPDVTSIGSTDPTHPRIYLFLGFGRCFGIGPLVVMLRSASLRGCIITLVHTPKLVDTAKTCHAQKTCCSSAARSHPEITTRPIVEATDRCRAIYPRLLGCNSLARWGLQRHCSMAFGPQFPTFWAE